MDWGTFIDGQPIPFTAYLMRWADGTPSGAVIDGETGCTLAHESFALRNLITNEEREAAVTSAAQSSCGEKK